mgnify:CR=1 FL=1
MITLQNNTKGTYIHGEHKLLPGAIITVPDDVAKIWLYNEGVIEYKDPQEAKAEVKALIDENARLKAEVEAMKKVLAEVNAEKEAKAEKTQNKKGNK